MRCEGDDRKYEPLWRVLEAAWGPTVHAFLKTVAERHGTSWEGVVSFAYGDDYPQADYPDEKLEPGMVRCSYFDEDLDVTEAFFRACAEAACCATLEAAARMGVEPKDAPLMREFVAKTPP